MRSNASKQRLVTLSEGQLIEEFSDAVKELARIKERLVQSSDKTDIWTRHCFETMRDARDFFSERDLDTSILEVIEESVETVHEERGLK